MDSDTGNRRVSIEPALDALLMREQKGANLQAAFAVLADGRRRTIAELVADAVTAGLLPPKTDTRVVYVSLLAYIDRARATGREPRVVQDPDRRFRINQTPDDWPDTQGLPTRPPAALAQALAKRLHDSETGPDSEAFEVAVCDTFAALGFVVQHVGGKGAPDAVLDAPLGTLGYRVMVECKTTQDNALPNPHVAEAAKFRAQYDAKYCMLVGPVLPTDNSEFASELRTHQVSGWRVADLVAALELGADPFEMRGPFEQLFAEDGIDTIRWDRQHGRGKRVLAIARLLCTEGWRAQQATAATPASAPRLTEDAAMLLVDGALHARGSAVICERADVLEAFAHLTSPLTAAAEWADTTRSGIVLRRPNL